MTIGIYKPGQGYWVRVLTATLIGVVTCAAAGWTAIQMSLVAEKLPRTVWSMKFEGGAANPPQPGQTLKLLSRGGATELGEARVRSFSASSNELRFDQVKMGPDHADPSVVKGGLVKVGEAQPVAVSENPTAEPAVEPALLQGLAAGIVLIIGAAIAFYFTAMHQRFVDFLIATDGEMKKVNWSTARDIRMSTLVVIFASFVLSASLFVVDLSFQWFFTKIGVLVH